MQYEYLDLMFVMRYNEYDSDRIESLFMLKPDGGMRVAITPFVKAAMLGKLHTVESFLAKGLHLNIRCSPDETSALDAAALMGHREIVTALIEHTSTGMSVSANDADSRGKTALYKAVSHGRASPIMDLLLAAGLDMDARTDQGRTLLHAAAYGPEPRDSTVTALLLDRGAATDAIDSMGRSPLYFAAQYGHLDVVCTLLRAGADATLRGKEEEEADATPGTQERHGPVGKAPLDVAAFFGRVQIARALIQHGVELDVTSHVGFTALHYAAVDVRSVFGHTGIQDRAGVAQALLEAGASSTTLAPTNATPLHCAAYNRSLEVMVVLLKHRAPLQWKQGDGTQAWETPLHSAAKMAGIKGAAEAVDILLRWGADECCVNSEGKTAAEVIPEWDLHRQELYWEIVYPRAYPDLDRIPKLLVNAPTDRIWRRRGMVLVCLSRNWQVKTNTQTARKRVMPPKGGPEEGSGSEGGESPENGGDLTGLGAWLLRFEEEGLTRQIVGCL